MHPGQLILHRVKYGFIALALAGNAHAAPKGIEVISGKAAGDFACVLVISPSEAAPPDTPVRLRLTLDKTNHIGLSATSRGASRQASIVAGDMRFDLADLPRINLAEFETDPLYTMIFGQDRVHLTLGLPGDAIATARFDRLDGEKIIRTLISDCGADNPALIGTDPQGARLVKYAALTVLGRRPDLADIAPGLTAADAALIEQALRRLSVRVPVRLRREHLDRLVQFIGLTALPRWSEVRTFAGAGTAARDGNRGWTVLDPADGVLGGPGLPPVTLVTRDGFVLRSKAGLAGFHPDATPLWEGEVSDLGPCTEGYCIWSADGAEGLLRMSDGARSTLDLDEVAALIIDRDESLAILSGRSGGWQRLDAAGQRLAGPLDAAAIRVPPGSGRRAPTTGAMQSSRGQWRLVDLTTLKPLGRDVFDDVLTDEGGRFRVQQGALWAALDARSGKLLFAPRFRGLGPFGAGLAPASLDGTLWGYVNADAEWVLPPAYGDAGPFRSGMARVALPGGGTGFIDAKGEWLVPPILDEARDSVDGRAAVRFGDLWGFVAVQGG